MRISSTGHGYPNPTTRKSEHSKPNCSKPSPTRGQLPGDELFHAVDYRDGSDEAFLGRLWRDLYGEQPGTEAGLHRAVDTAFYEDLAGRLYGLLIGLDDRLDREAARQLYHFIEVGEYGPGTGGDRWRACLR
jgi:hypothetical protein